MRIRIQNRYKPFTKKAGAFVLLPFSHYALQIFPAKIFVLDLTRGEQLVAEIDIEMPSPADSFTIELDLEKGLVIIHGTLEGKFFRNFVFFDEKIIFHLDKPQGRFHVSKDRDDIIRFQDKLSHKKISSEKISFGNFKKQNFEKIQEREDIREILPLWHALAKVIPEAKADLSSPSLLSDLHQNKEQLVPLFKHLFRTGFQSLFYPKMQEFNYLGYKNPPFIAQSPLALIHEGGAIMRSLFYQFEKETLTLLPFVPRELTSGRMIGFPMGDWGYFDCEWRSGRLIQVAISPLKEIELNLVLPKEVKSFRVRNLKNTKVLKIENILKLDAYTLLDRFIT